MQTWTTKDKADWGDGPWQDEPDKVHWVHQGLDCLIVRNNGGALCGYVGVPESHPLFGKSYHEVDLDCHGGLTFSDRCADVAEVDEGRFVCHPKQGAANEVVWWFGFDCAHCDDKSPAYNKHSIFTDGVYRDVAYVTREVESLVAQVLRDAA